MNFNKFNLYKSFNKQQLVQLLPITCNSLKFFLHNPPKPHAFISLPLQSGTNNSNPEDDTMSVTSTETDINVINNAHDFNDNKRNTIQGDIDTLNRAVEPLRKREYTNKKLDENEKEAIDEASNIAEEDPEEFTPSSCESVIQSKQEKIDKLDDLISKGDRASQNLDQDTSDYNAPSILDQFDIIEIIKLQGSIFNKMQITFTNIGVYLTISYVISILIVNNMLFTNKLFYTTWSILKETVYDTVYSIVNSQIQSKKGETYFPLMYTLFTFILINNLIGMIPYSFAPTSHFIITFALSFTIVIGSTLIGLLNYILGFFSLFVPNGCPLILVPLLVLIEFISYLARNISLGLRLAANIFSGHMLLNILSGFTYKIMTSNFIFFIVSLIPLAFIIAFSGLELCIAFIQAQVFILLSCSYIKDGLIQH